MAGFGFGVTADDGDAGRAMAVSPSPWARGTPCKEGHKQRQPCGAGMGFGPSMRCFSSTWLRGGGCGKVQSRLQCFKHPPTVHANQLHADVIGHANVTGRLFTCAVYIRGARMCAKER